MPYPVVVVTGDSIAQQSFKVGGYGSALVDLYQGNYDVLNRGMGGYNSTQLLQRFQEGLDIPAGADVRLIVIHIGTNDCVERGYQKVSATDYRANLLATIQHIRSTYPRTEIIFLTPSTVETETILALEKSSGMPDHFISYRTPERARELAEVCKQVAAEQDLDCIDVFKMHDGKQGIFTDGLHYNEVGYKPVCDALLDVITHKFPDLVPDDFPRAFPMFATYGRDGDQNAQAFADAINEIGERQKATKNLPNGKGAAVEGETLEL